MGTARACAAEHLSTDEPVEHLFTLGRQRTATTYVQQIRSTLGASAASE